MSVMRTSIHGRRFGLGDKDQLVSNEVSITTNAVDASISVGATQAAGITIQVKNSDGSPISHAQALDLYVLKDATPTGLATSGGSTGIAIGANGFIAATLVSKKFFKVFTDATGLLKLTWTDNASEAAFLGVFFPTGRLLISAALPTS